MTTASRASLRRHRIAVVALSVVVLALGAMVGLPFYYRHVYHRWPWQDTAAQVSACGRDYVDPDTADPQSLRTASETDGVALHQVGSTGGWFHTQEIWGHRYRGPEYSGTECGLAVWLRVGHDQFVRYSLSGGP